MALIRCPDPLAVLRWRMAAILLDGFDLAHGLKSGRVYEIKGYGTQWEATDIDSGEVCAVVNGSHAKLICKLVELETGITPIPKEVFGHAT